MATKKTKSKKKKRMSARKTTEAQSSSSYSTLEIPEGVKMCKLQEGTMRLNIIPFEAGEGNPFADPGELHYEREFYIHRGIGPGGNESHICPNKTAKKKCPICEDIVRMNREPDADKKLISDLLPRKRQVFNVEDLENAPDEVQLLECSFHLFGKLLNKRVNKANPNDEDEEHYEYFADPEEGSTLKLGVDEKAEPFKHMDVTSIDFKKRKKPLSDELLEAAVCLDDILKIPSYKELKELYFQVSEDDDEDEDDDDEPRAKKKKAKRQDDDDDEEEDDDEKPSKKKKKPTKKRRDDDEEEEDEEDDEDEEDEDEEEDEEEDEDELEDKPKNKKKGSKKVLKKKSKSKKDDDWDEDDDEEDEDDDFDDDDEDEDDEPKKKKKGVKSKKSPKKKKRSKDDEEDDEDSIPF